ncbi:hypothetical protein [Chitinophaga sp. sic0106]|uniref:hypothetical protein n=1 Tax=Chitinophaga sp. sic0106 TaxID=2854785 RepID=UPI001C47F4E1|nr:hypothetical protein [Chitinophaga sp. sic0106]MBV7530821.1 hypothetical protein [Chitinophaga sp. sic0106]
MSNCHCHTEVTRDGSGQLDRFLAALDPSYAAVDGRSIEDLLLFAKKLAEQLRFYDVPEAEGGGDTPGTKPGWVEFFRRDMAVLAAAVSSSKTEAVKATYDQLRATVDKTPDLNNYEALFKPIVSMMVLMDEWYTLAIPGNPLQTDLHLLIQSTLSEQVKKLIAYAEGYRTVDVKKNITIDFTDIENDELWKVNDPIDADNSIYDGDTPEEMIRNASLYIDDIFLSFYGGLQQLVNNGDAYMQFALKEFPSHQPHMGLFIAFLQLFRLVQQQANGITGRMLDFYYRDVLHLEEKPSVPDRAHVIFELAKDVVSYPVDPGTALSAGKDAGGKEQTYFTTEGLVVNQAKVKELKTIYIDKDPDEGEERNKMVRTIYSRPMANSLDGYGAQFLDKYPHWPTFGQGPTVVQQYSERICRILDQPIPEEYRNDKTSIGFAVASPQLLLEGGRRFLIIQFNGLNKLIDPENRVPSQQPFKLYFSGEKEWLEVSIKDSYGLPTVYEALMSTGVFPDSTPEYPAYCPYKTATGGYYLLVNIPLQAPAVVGFKKDVYKDYAFNTTFPVMRIMLDPELNLSASDYHDMVADSFSIEVRVGSLRNQSNPNTNELMHPYFDGLKKLVIQNDYGIQASNKPFDPFTLYPVRGKSFYIGSEEVFNKELDALGVNIERTGDMAGLSSNAEVAVNILQDKQWKRLATQENRNDGGFNQIELSHDILQLYTPEYGNGAPSQLSFYRDPILPVSAWDTNTIKGFLKITNIYNPSAGGGEFPPPPPPPQEIAALLEISQVSVSYVSRQLSLERGIDQFFHVYPFGVAEIEMLEKQFNTNGVSTNYNDSGNYLAKAMLQRGKTLEDPIDADEILLPQFTFTDPFSRALDEEGGMVNNEKYLAGGNLSINPKRNDLLMAELMLHATGLSDSNRLNQYSGIWQEEGMLFIGLENVAPLQTLSLLFEFADGTAEDDETDPPQINWSYLINNEWRPLPGECLVSDGTYGFQTTGIIKIDVPQDITNASTIITSGLSWLCASVTNNANCFPHLINVVAQATEVTFKDQDNDQRHFDAALPAGSISKLSVKVAEISKVDQPFASYDGKHREAGKEFYTRVSERLRHKGRAITSWDYERLVLNRYPSIYKVKTIPHTDPNCICWHSPVATNPNGEPLCCEPQQAPGHVLLVPLANLKNRTALNPLQPKTGRRTLLEIEKYLQQRSSPFVKVRARNPLYEQVMVAFRVQFVDGTDKGYFLKKLNEEIVRYLTPWAFDEDVAPVFGQKVYASAIINFIEERPYVDFIADFAMFVCKKDCCETDVPIRGERGTNDDDLGEQLMKARNCDDVEAAMLSQTSFTGVVVAVPSTPRSILVSVPKHIIIPYKAAPVLSPCEQRNRPAPAAVVNAVATEDNSRLKATAPDTTNVAKDNTVTVAANATNDITKTAIKENVTANITTGISREPLTDNTAANIAALSTGAAPAGKTDATAKANEDAAAAKPAAKPKAKKATTSPRKKPKQ